MLVPGCQKVDPNITAKDVVPIILAKEIILNVYLFTTSKKTQNTSPFRDVNINDK